MKRNTIPGIAITVFFLSACGGQQTETKQAVASGEDIYKNNCVSCHQAGGEGLGSTYPPLAKSSYLADREKTIEMIVKGKTGEIEVNGKKYNSMMPPQSLSDEEVAAVLTYVYGNMGNSGGAVTTDDVKTVRAKQ